MLWTSIYYPSSSVLLLLCPLIIAPLAPVAVAFLVLYSWLMAQIKIWNIIVERMKYPAPQLVTKQILAARKGTESADDVCVQNNNKAWEPVDLFLSFLRSKEKCTYFEL